MSDYVSKYAKGEKVLVSREWKYKEATVLDITLDYGHAERTRCPMSEFYVFYRIKFWMLGIPRSIWVRGDDIHGLVKARD